jgi:hypothetical protein
VIAYSDATYVVLAVPAVVALAAIALVGAGYRARRRRARSDAERATARTDN